MKFSIIFPRLHKPPPKPFTISGRIRSQTSLRTSRSFCRKIGTVIIITKPDIERPNKKVLRGFLNSFSIESISDDNVGLGSGGSDLIE